MLRRDGDVFLFGTAMAESSFKTGKPNRKNGHTLGAPANFDRVGKMSGGVKGKPARDSRENIPFIWWFSALPLQPLEDGERALRLGVRRLREAEMLVR
ncbi:MAG TPA: hypothetical protein VF410_02720, partial [Rhizomicrobium sp.]